MQVSGICKPENHYIDQHLIWRTYVAARNQLQVCQEWLKSVLWRRSHKYINSDGPRQSRNTNLFRHIIGLMQGNDFWASNPHDYLGSQRTQKSSGNQNSQAKRRSSRMVCHRLCVWFINALFLIILRLGMLIFQDLI